MSVPNPSKEDREVLRSYYDELGQKEWQRLDRDVAARVSFEIHRRFLERFIKPKMDVLEIGAGPGRFTFELAKLEAQVLVTDFSKVQLELNHQMLKDTGAERSVVGRAIVDVCDTSRFSDGQFDAVLAYGGPLSYAFEDIEDALSGLFRITKPNGVVVFSVMSILGTWRYKLPSVIDFAADHGEELNDAILATGDLRLRGDSHRCKMFRSDEMVELIAASGGKLLAVSASNWASMNQSDVLASLAAYPSRWAHFLENEIVACAHPGAWDGGTHILFAATPS